MATQSSTQDVRPPEPANRRDGLHALAELAFGSLTRTDEPLQGQHLAVLQAESLELDLSDPAQRQFGDYELLELLGEGGMGAVYRARHVPLDREVAVKLLSAGPWASRDFIARFEREAQHAARMQHPNIVTVYEAGSHEGLHFFSMRLVEGNSLSALLKRGERFAPAAAAALMRTVAEAVGYAHSLGVLHLDLKPGNVLVDASGVPHVADFGLARRLDSAAMVANEEVSGTPAYMAPEQAQARSSRLTAATDVWGLGAVLYELLTGEPPFRAESAQATLKLVLEGKVRAPRRLQPTLPLDLQAIVMRCLAHAPGERYPSARALADDLQRYVEGRPVQARPLNVLQKVWRWARREPRLAATAMLAFAALVIGLVMTTAQWRRADASASAARENLWATRAETAQQALNRGDGFRSLRPLIANLAEMESAGNGGKAAIERLRIGTILANAPRLVDLMPLPAGERATSLAISPDGRRFAVATIETYMGGARRVHQYDLASLRELWSVSTDHRTFLVAAGDFGTPQGGLRYTADGRYLTISVVEQQVVPAPRRSDMIVIDARDGSVLMPQGLPRRQADVVYDDTVQLALVRYRSSTSLRWPDSAQFHEVAGWRPIGPLHTRNSTLAADHWLPAPPADGPVWLGTRDSTQLTLYEVPSLKPRWHLQLPPASLVRAWGFSHAGHWIALGSVDGAVRLVDVATGGARAMATTPTGRVLSVEFSDDDRTLAAMDENGQLWSWDVATGTPRAAPWQMLRNHVFIAQVRHAGATLFAEGVHDGSAELGYAALAPRAPFNNEVVPGSAHMSSLSIMGVAFDVSTRAARLITASAGNLIEVWRLPPSPLRAPRAAPLPPWRQTFDGQRLLSVAGDTIRVLDPVSGTPRSPPLRFPEPVRFAEFSSDGHALATIAGRTVRVIDPATWRLRGAPIVLPGTPERAFLAEGAPVLVLTTADYAGNVRHDRIQRVDLARGTVLGSAVSVVAIEHFDIDPQGRHALVMTWDTVSHDETGPAYISLDDGAAACHPALVGVRTFAFAPDGRSAWFDVALHGQSSLRRWDLATCRELAAYDRRQRETATPALIARADGGVIAHRAGNHALLMIDGNGQRRAALGTPIADAMHDFAVSADGTRAAFATRNAVHLLDAQQGLRLSAPLAAPIAGDDAIAKLAFSPDGSRLLGRTINGRWLFWELPRATPDTAMLSQLAAVLDPVPAGAPTTAEIESLRVRLRAAIPAVPAIAPPASPVAKVFAPAAGAGVDPRFVPLDLGPAINVPMIGRVWPEPAAGGDLPTLAPGPQRFLGIDYRVDGGVQLIGSGSATALGPELHRSAVIAVPGVIARRVHVLAFMHIPMASHETSRAFARVVLIGADGRETPLEIRTVRDVVTHAEPDVAAPTARIAFSGMDDSTARGGEPVEPFSNVYAVTLHVPPATGPIRGLRFEEPGGSMEAPLLFAATLEK